jgi:tetratricopeptide (TPR) repeat protein
VSAGAGARLTAGALLAVAWLGAAIGLQAARDRLYPRREAQDQALLYVRSGEAMRRIVLSFDALAADVYWIRTLQHYGAERLSRTSGEPEYELLYPLLDLTTSLDPYFRVAYRFGAIFLSEAYPGGPGRPDLAIALLKKGIAVEPTEWQYYHDIAFVHYWQLGDPETAAQWFRKAAAQPDAADWLEPLAASMLLRGGERASARFLLRELLKSEQAWVRRMAARSLAQVDALDWMDQLERIAAAEPPPEGQPYSWDWLIGRGRLERVPVDPSGAPFDIDPGAGRVSVSRSSELFPMPADRRVP